MRTIAIGDIHGCIRELDELLALLRPMRADRLILLGDLVDRGPDSAAVVRRVRELDVALGSRLVVLRGNHESKHLRHHLAVRQHTGRRAPAVKLDEHRLEVHAQVGAEGWDFLERRAVLFARPGALLCVHAGVLPSVRVWPLRPEGLDRLPPDRRKRLETAALFVRDVDVVGRFVPIGEQAPGQRYWADVYDGRFGHAVHGHSPTMGAVRRHPHATGIDTGCVFGGLLTAAVWEGPVRTARPPDSYVQVRAERAWAPWNDLPPPD